MTGIRSVIILSIIMFCLSGAIPVKTFPQEPPMLSIELKAKTTSVGVMESPKVDVIISNRGSDPVVLVRPGDGSDRELRTPLTRWLIEPVPGEGNAEGILRTVMNCGNINALRREEVFTLAPGQSENLPMSVWAVFSKPGKYRVRFEYENRPLMEWGGIVLGQHYEGTMLRVRESTACKLTSNEVIFVVTEEQDATDKSR